MTAALFIGGPWDGRMVEHRLDSPTMTVHTREPVLIKYDPYAPIKEPTWLNTHTYLRVTVLGTCYYIEKTVFDRGIAGLHAPHEVVLDLLRQGYRRPSDIYGD